MGFTGRENLDNIVPRVLSLMRDSPYLRLCGKLLFLRASVQDINFLEENGFRFNYEREDMFENAFCLEISANYLFDMLCRFQNPNFHNAYKWIAELRTPLIRRGKTCITTRPL